MSWITIRTTSTRWEAELMEQLLTAQEIPTRLLDCGVASYLGMGSPTALQVAPEHRWSALLLLSEIEEIAEE
ncbi:DUF2007 domain-containing protein [Roseofilum sp. BLCC_M154]|uniref:DUF2007 domain-containing protein n=1 Tax=Roseofilum acuticapitatum BLCC-M154 TaxID=3022444 RepID=A0ABT7AM12_9CYAN|nr:DUF2007 domain-containing protein [Roseofilum acuticapitatum]MDJ1167938.1 DUF2007 domain-containing protein [Roseofilum acuticapitatum BLCC-M154]